MPGRGSFALAVLVAVSLAAGPLPGRAATAAPSPAAKPAAPPAAAAKPAAPAAAAPTPAPVDPRSDAGLANYQKGVTGLKKIPDLYAFVTHQGDLAPLLKENAKDYDSIRYQVVETGADWPLFVETHKAIQADAALKGKVGGAATSN